ncbi:MAG TPA: hypothetical protein VM939_05985 [Gemmatimonadaceae bacterium]|nr:hypothetical protein [Gemmatimonadaceae bacterium]
MTDDILDETKLRDLLARAAQLPKNIDPPAHAWAQIRSAIDGDMAARAPAGVVRFWQRPAFLAAAALLLVAVSSGVTAVALRGTSDSSAVATNATAETQTANGVPSSTDRPGVTPSGSVEAVSRQTAAPATLAEFTVVEKDYIVTANRLSQLLAQHEAQLAPATVETLKESLRIIDEAILEARRALAADPANSALVEMLSGSHEKKLDLLRRTTEMARSGA